MADPGTAVSAAIRRAKASCSSGVDAQHSNLKAAPGQRLRPDPASNPCLILAITRPIADFLSHAANDCKYSAEVLVEGRLLRLEPQGFVPVDLSVPRTAKGYEHSAEVVVGRRVTWPEA
jgi:hypothetical protein